YSKSVEMLKCSLRLLLHYFVVSNDSSACLKHYLFSNARLILWGGHLSRLISTSATTQKHRKAGNVKQRKRLLQDVTA
ncbi:MULTISPECIES: hypothetical protein, partial [Cyanophyceae]|uniref:hypothetical protein n=1 Tax=Cyanophyceae TaxID=3028117 RepID=UPI001A7EEDC2